MMKSTADQPRNAKALGAFQSWWNKLGGKRGLPSPEKIFLAGYEGIIPFTERDESGIQIPTGRRKDEIEVTPEMIEEGVDALRPFVNGLISPTSRSLKAAAKSVYLAMSQRRPL